MNHVNWGVHTRRRKCIDLPLELGIPIAKNSFREDDQSGFVGLGTVGVVDVLVKEGDERNGLKGLSGTHLVCELRAKKIQTMSIFLSCNETQGRRGLR